jgi:hypothetical protein
VHLPVVARAGPCSVRSKPFRDLRVRRMRRGDTIAGTRTGGVGSDSQSALKFDAAGVRRRFGPAHCGSVDGPSTLPVVSRAAVSPRRVSALPAIAASSDGHPPAPARPSSTRAEARSRACVSGALKATGRLMRLRSACN